MLRAVVFQTMMMARGFIRLPLKILMFIFAVVFAIDLFGPAHDLWTALGVGVFFVGCAMLLHYYDWLLVRMAPDGDTIYLPH